MTDSDVLAVVCTLAGVVLGLLAGVWWFWVPCCVLLVVEILCLLPAYSGGGVPEYRREPDALDEIQRTLRSIERSQYSD